MSKIKSKQFLRWSNFFQEKRKLQDEVDDVTDRLNEEIESRRKMADKLSHERHTNQKEKECTQGVRRLLFVFIGAVTWSFITAMTVNGFSVCVVDRGLKKAAGTPAVV